MEKLVRDIGEYLGALRKDGEKIKSIKKDRDLWKRYEDEFISFVLEEGGPDDPTILSELNRAILYATRRA